MKKEYKSYFFLTIAILLVATTPAIIKNLIQKMDPFQILFFITLFAFITLFIVSLIKGQKEIIKNYTKKDYLVFFYMGALGIFLYTLLASASLIFISAQENIIVNYLWPVIVVFLSWLILKEKLTSKKIIAIIIAFFGAYIVLTKGNLIHFTFSSTTGILLALAAAFAQALYFTLGKKQNYEKITSIMFFYLFATILSFFALILFSTFPTLTLKDLLTLLWLGGFAGGIGFVFFFLAYEYGEVHKISTLAYLSPFACLIYTRIIVGEKILLSSIVGLFVILLGIFIQLKKKKPKKEINNY